MRVAEGLEWKQIYWVRGKVPRHSEYRNEVTDPPCAGWQHAYVIPGDRRSTIFCPHTFQAYAVTNASLEIRGAGEPKGYHGEGLVRLIRRNWAEYQALGYQRDYDTCALVLRRLGEEVPEQVQTGGGQDVKKRGGKPAADALTKPVKRSGKRGRFLGWFLEGGGSRSVRETMAEFSMTRSNALSYLHMINRDHGIGYGLVGDTATIDLPDDCVDPFDTPAVVDDDSWLD